ncbi:uncharacterized protein TRIVIDRAFT_42602, partial [Trichoderma virens Gv29-8]
DKIVQDLNKARAGVVKIFQNAGIVGLATHVIFQGKIIWTANMGYENLQFKVPMDSNTILPIGALSQGFTAACVAQQVYRGELSYDTKVSAIFPQVKNKDATIGDLLGHRTGLQTPDNLLQAKYACRFSMDWGPIDKFVQLFNDLQPQANLRSQFLHNSIGYALLGGVVRTKNNYYYVRQLKENILEPLQMAHTKTVWLEKHQSGPRYSAGSNGSQYAHEVVNCLDTEDFQLSAAVGGMTSTTNDLAKYCIALNKAWKRRGPAADDEARNLRGNEVFPDVDLLFNPLQPMGDIATDGKAKKNHAAGWATCTLPAAIGDIGINPGLIDMPILGGGSAPVRMIWNQGMYDCANAFVALLPEYEAAVIVLGNTTTGSDTADWIGQHLIQALLDSPCKNDYPFLASMSALNARQKYWELVAKLEQGRQTKGPQRPLDQYKGLYRNASDEDLAKGGKKRRKSPLMICFTGSILPEHPLHYHHGDTFTWLQSWNKMLKGEFRVSYHPEYYSIRFQPNKDGSGIDSFVWVNDPAKPEGEVFTRHPAWWELI